MTKTFTPSNLVNSTHQASTESAADVTEQQDELFYHSIAPQLNELIKDPSNESIEKILAYSKNK